MIEVQNGDTVIKVMPHKVDEMIRKGWHLVTDEPVAESEEIIEDDSDYELDEIIEDDSEGGIEDGDS